MYIPGSPGPAASLQEGNDCVDYELLPGTPTAKAQSHMEAQIHASCRQLQVITSFYD